MRKWIFAVPAALALMTDPGVADAAYLRYELTGVITEVLKPGVTSVIVGDAWLASVYVDEGTPDLLSAIASTGRYTAVWSTISLGASLSLQFPGFRPTVEVINNDPVDFLLFWDSEVAGGACIDGFCLGTISMDYTDTTSLTVQDSTLAGTIGLTIDDYDNVVTGGPVGRAAFSAKFRDPSTGRVTLSTGRILGTPTGLEVTLVDTLPTPLPPTLWLAATGLAAVAAAGGRSRKSRTGVLR